MSTRTPTITTTTTSSSPSPSSEPPASTIPTPPPPTPTKTPPTSPLTAITTAITTNTIKNILILVGAGLSTTSGIPDFRTPKSGLYALLTPLNLPYPEALFHISYFRHTPEPFYAIARARHPRNLKPGVGHAFLVLLEKRGVLGGVLSQNIDGLECDAGVSKHKVLNAHGDWSGQGCIKCKARFGDEGMRAAIERGEVPRCERELELELPDGNMGLGRCGGIIKPDIVMFGESLPKEFDEWVEDLVPRADLLIVVGTSLKVYPVAGIPKSVSPSTPRILINNELVGDFGTRDTDVCLIGDVEDGFRKLAKELGWEEELDQIWKEAVERKEKDVEAQGWKDEGPSLEQCIAKAAEKMKARMGVSQGHRDMLEGHLGEKMAGILGKMSVRE